MEYGTTEANGVKLALRKDVQAQYIKVAGSRFSVR